MEREHLSRQFAAELNAIRLGLLEMGGIVELMITNAARALTERDSALAQRAIAADSETNRLELEIDQRCVQLLAQRQPAARDLRLVTMALKTVTDLEQMGDHCVAIARQARELNAEGPLAIYQDLRPIAETTGALVKDALDAFVREDATLAARVLEEDDDIDRASESLQQELIAIMQSHPSNISRAMRLDSVSRYFERIADHATNIAEGVIFLVHGKDVRHARLAEQEAALSGKRKEAGVHAHRRTLSLCMKRRAVEDLMLKRRARSRRSHSLR